MGNPSMRPLCFKVGLAGIDPLSALLVNANATSSPDDRNAAKPAHDLKQPHCSGIDLVSRMIELAVRAPREAHKVI
jgi:hypothetical protein